MTPLDYYRQQCEKGNISADENQLQVLTILQKIHADLITEHDKRTKLIAFLRKPQVVQGLYLWGGVGVGKTFLMDCFYHALPFQKKMRMHFHQFMRFIHQELRQHQGEKNPLTVIANALAKKTLVLCFDEFVVTDIADAMILARLLKALFAAGVCLVTTSNTQPDELYLKGLQRKLFLPAIELIKKHTHVMHIPTTIDYRLRHLKHAGVFYHPNDFEAEENMEKSFALLIDNANISTAPIEILDRTIKIRKQAADVVWFDFNVICSAPRSQHDYLAIAEKYRTIFISDIPIIPAKARDVITLFIRLIDVLYDQRTRLVFSAVADIDSIYTEGTLLNDFKRTRSRLLEMQSENYFA